MARVVNNSEFTLDIERFIKKAKRNAEEVMRKTTIKLFSAVIMASPVDTGRFRANWMTSGANPATGTTESTDPTAARTVGAMESYISLASDWDAFSLANNLPYAERLEYDGWSSQAPAGMVRVNVRRFNYLLEREANKVK